MIHEIRTSSDNLLIIPDSVQHTTLSFFVKRCLDIVLATVLLVLLTPILLLIALAIRLDSPGKVLFTQDRVGGWRRLYGNQLGWEVRTFKMYKFRTMHQNADQSLHERHIKAFVAGQLSEHHTTTGTFKLTNDPRVTRIGAILRKLSLDELPQLWNVLRGEMSLVGPRPVPVYEAAAYQSSHRERLAALPGITGLWQVKGRSQVSFESMIAMDIEYVRNQSVWMDLKILAQTAWIVVSGFGGG